MDSFAGIIGVYFDFRRVAGGQLIFVRGKNLLAWASWLAFLRFWVALRLKIAKTAGSAPSVLDARGLGLLPSDGVGIFDFVLFVLYFCRNRDIGVVFLIILGLHSPGELRQR